MASGAVLTTTLRGKPQAAKNLRQVSIRPGVSVLSVLRYLNYKPWFALAEFVDNAVQSFVENEAQLKALHGPDWCLSISIELDTSEPGRIVVRDNAAGISTHAFPRAFRPAAVPPNRSGLSEFGMGMKSAACWFARKWTVRTKALGDSVARTVRFDIAAIVKDDLEDLDIIESPAFVSEHYTEVSLEELHNVPVGRTVSKIKEHLADIYRVFLREGSLVMTLNGERLVYEEPAILRAPYVKDFGGEERLWRKEINFPLGPGLAVHGFAALRDPGNYARSGFALFRRKRLIEGSGDEGYRPPLLFGTGGSSSYARLRLFGELHLEGFDVSHTKDGFRWDENEQPFLELLKEHLDSEELPLLRQCEAYRSLASRKDREQVATRALNSTVDAIESSMEAVLPGVADLAPVDTCTLPLDPKPLIAKRELRFAFRGEPWLVKIELSDDRACGDWLSISDHVALEGTTSVLEIRICMAHPFMVAFAQTDISALEPVLRVAAALALSEKLARRAGVKSSGTLRRNLNEILREALSRP